MYQKDKHADASLETLQVDFDGTNNMEKEFYPTRDT